MEATNFTNKYDGWDEKPIGWEKTRKEANKRIIDIDIYNYTKIANDYKDKELDAIIVLAGGLNEKGLVHEFVEERLNLAIEIYKSRKDGIKIISLGGGTYHKPPILNDRNFVIHESTACSEYLIVNGVDPKDIYKEYSSYDTIANGFYAYLNFISPLELRKILVITSEFHMPRSKAIFNWIMSFDDALYEPYYESTPNKGMTEEVLNARKIREFTSLNNLQNNLIPKIKNIKEFHQWFYEEHKAYCSNSEMIRQNDIDDQTKKTY